MNFVKSYFFKILVCMLLFALSATIGWCYRGSSAARCRSFIHERIPSAFKGDVDATIKEIEKVNENHNHNDCKYDYSLHESEIVVFCKVHGSGSNISMLSHMSADSYFKNRYNNEGFCSGFVLGLIGIMMGMTRLFFMKKTNKE